MSNRTKLAHIVYFSLKESSPAAIESLVAACDKYLSGHPGVIYYSAGSLVGELTREVNQRDWDVALHVVFDSKASHDAYQTAPRHQQFIDENKPTWAKVRVFDAYV